MIVYSDWHIQYAGHTGMKRDSEAEMMTRPLPYPRQSGGGTVFSQSGTKPVCVPYGRSQLPQIDEVQCTYAKPREGMEDIDTLSRPNLMHWTGTFFQNRDIASSLSIQILMKSQKEQAYFSSILALPRSNKPFFTFLQLYRKGANGPFLCAGIPYSKQVPNGSILLKNTARLRLSV